MSLQIRPIENSEREIWNDLMVAYASFYKTEVTPEARDSVWSWIFDTTNDFWCDVALQDGKIVGFTQYQLMHRSLGGSMVCYLSDLYVDPEIRGAGAGRALINHVLEFAKLKGLPGVRWLTQEYNYTARKLYDSYQSKTDFILYNVPV